MALGEKKRVVMEEDLAVPGGVATLDDEGKLPLEQAPTLPVSIHAKQHETNGDDPLTPAMIGTLDEAQIRALVEAVQAATETAQATAETAQSVAEAAQSAASAKATVATGTYTGNNANSKTLTFPFKPIIGFVFPNGGSGTTAGTFFTQSTCILTYYGSGNGLDALALGGTYGVAMSWSGNSVTISTVSSHVQGFLNDSRYAYRYVVIG